MTSEQRNILNQRIGETIAAVTKDPLALEMVIIGFLRYERLRRLNPRQFSNLHNDCLVGARFDDQVDILIANDLLARKAELTPPPPSAS